MDPLPQEVDDYIRESIDHTLGLPVSTQTLELKLRCAEATKRRLRYQYTVLLAKSRAEPCMNAQAWRKFVEENQRLAPECAHLVSQCNKLENECSLYDHDREALMDFWNEADQRAKEAEFRVEELEDEQGELREELKFYKNEYERLSTSLSLHIDAGDLLHLLHSPESTSPPSPASCFRASTTEMSSDCRSLSVQSLSQGRLLLRQGVQIQGRG